MEKGVKKIKWIVNGGALTEYSSPDKILCIVPNKEAQFIVGEWYNDTTEEEKRRELTWLLMDQKKRNILKKTRKPVSEPYGVTFPKKLCGSYAFYIEASLYGAHDRSNTGLHVYGKCEEKITKASWSKSSGAVDTSEINYGHNLFFTIETEGLNGDILTVELYSEKKSDSIKTVKAKCINGTIVDAKFSTIGINFSIPFGVGLLPGELLIADLESFYIKISDITGKHITDASGKENILSFTIKNKQVIPVFERPTNTTPLRVGTVTVEEVTVEEVVKIEGILEAYFAKEEFTKQTIELDGNYEYKFASDNIEYDKNKIAGIIKSKVDIQVKANKKYAKLDDIKSALTAESYAKDTTITFNLYKLGAEYKKINSAPLEEEVFVVAKTYLLDGKEVSITIKEKEAIVVDADADVNVVEAKENGAELTTLKATVENDIAKIKIKLRPKADEDLTKWKEKLLKGKKEGTYSYTFKSERTTITDNNKKELARIILKNAKEGKQGNTKIADGKTAFADDVEKVLQSKTYSSGDIISFDTYKIQAENLWLKAECQGDSQKYEEEFMKRDGEYFVIGKGKCPRCGILTMVELDKIFTNATREKKEQLMNTFNLANSKFGLNTCQQKAHFFAQVLEEVGTSINIKDGEGLNYAVEKLTEHYSRFSTTGLQNGPPNDLAFSYGRIDSNNISFLRSTYNRHNLTQHSANVQMIANIAYAHKEDNGDVTSGDGWKYRGRGIIQITYKRKYTNINRRITSDYPEYGKIIDANNINNLDEGTVASMAYWKEYRCQKKAEDGVLRPNLDAIVDIINSGTNTRDSRWGHLQNMVPIFKVTDCQKDAGSCTDDSSQCFNYADVWDNPEISSDNGGKNNNRYGYNTTRGHKGVDILSGPEYKDVHSLMCGTVGKIVDTFETNEYRASSLGNTLMIKSKDKDGKEIFILYCHLDEIYVIEGAKVKHGQKVAKSGSTGNASYSGLPNGVAGRGIEKENWHCHIEAATKGEGSNNFYYLGSYRLKAEDYMKTKFDDNGNKI
ncbi:peptidoglycan DD-metalloendopeptidase family protein [Flavobacterium sp. PL002]|uniref:peptidoglycan DD-metalloendopeptidase family protein n=1 Tax=Flavobacterium sp. PL002 TaxID=1897058 RepID=UPI0017878AE2|nr:peptidoglycan DD-metalloendopeptidase family protein [Flavobacterium sp. PL002]MBE0393782.1 hypothetical protein [Flavobacterium sp. PL002]